MSTSRHPLEAAEPALFWFSALVSAVCRGDFAHIDHAQRELERVGYVVRIVEPISSARGAQDAKA